MQMKFYSPLTADFFPNEPDYEDEFYDEYEGYPQDGHELLEYKTGANGYLKKIPEPPDKSVTYTMGSKGEVTAVFNSVTYSSYGTTSTSTQQS